MKITSIIFYAFLITLIFSAAFSGLLAVTIEIVSFLLGASMAMFYFLEEPEAAMNFIGKNKEEE